MRWYGVKNNDYINYRKVSYKYSNELDKTGDLTSFEVCEYVNYSRL